MLQSFLSAGIRPEMPKNLQKNIRNCNTLLLILGCVTLLSCVIFFIQMTNIMINLVCLGLILMLWGMNKMGWHVVSRWLMSVLGVIASVYSGLAATPQGAMIPASYYALCFSLILLPLALFDKQEKIAFYSSVIMNVLAILCFPFLTGSVPNTTDYTMASSLPVQTATVVFALISGGGILYLYGKE